MAVDTVFMKAGNLLKVCEVTDTEGKVMKVEPYAIYISAKNRRSYLCYHLGDPEGWKYLEARFVASFKMLEERFTIRRDYDPFDKTRFPIVHFSIPTHHGRQRWTDKGAGDKRALPYRPDFEGGGPV